MESFVLEIFFLKNLNVYNSFQLRNTAGNRVVCLNCFGKLAGPTFVSFACTYGIDFQRRFGEECEETDL